MPSPSLPSPSGEQQTASSDQKGQQEAAEDLIEAGQKVADAGKQMPGNTGEPDMPSSPAGGATGESGEPDDPGEPDDMLMEDDLAGGFPGDSDSDSDRDSDSDDFQPEGGAVSGELSEEIRALQEALERAGIQLQTAGEMLETAASAEELAELEAALAKARVNIIVAGQDLLEARETHDGIEDEWLMDEAEAALNEANVAIVVATDSILASRIELPEFEQQQAQGGAGGTGESELDKELNESIVVFENQILEARAEVIGRAPAPTSSENIPGVAVLGGNPDPGGEGTFKENESDEMIVGDPDLIEQGRMPEGAELASVDKEQQSLIPDDIPDPQGDDIVAQQLREAAIAETDPDLRDKLWEEYKRYKSGL